MYIYLSDPDSLNAKGIKSIIGTTVRINNYCKTKNIHVHVLTH